MSTVPAFTMALRSVAVAAVTVVATYAQDAVWLQAEKHEVLTGEALLIEADTGDYGSMARAEASEECFIRILPGARLRLGPLVSDRERDWTVWVRAFALDGRRATVHVDDQAVGTSSGGSGPIILLWQRLGRVHVPAGEHAVELLAAEGNTNMAYVDVVAFHADDAAVPFGGIQGSTLTVTPQNAIREDFGTPELESLRDRWLIRPPPGADALVEMTPREDDGAIHIHNGAGSSYRLISKSGMRLRPGDQITARVRARKGTLVEHLSLAVPQVGRLTPQLYRSFTTDEETWIVPPGVSGPVQVMLQGGGGGDTYISRVEVFRPEPPLPAFSTGRFIAPTAVGEREGRLFEIEAHVRNRQAFSDADEDGDGIWTLCRLPHAENRPWFSRGTALKSDTVVGDRQAPEDGCTPLHVVVGPLLPGKYDVFLNAPGRPLAFSRDGVSWERLPGDRGSGLGLIEVRDSRFEFWLDDRYADDLNPGPTYADFIRFMPVEDPAHTMAPPPEVPTSFRSTVRRQRVPLRLAHGVSAADTPLQVRFGLPIPRGQLGAADEVALLGPRGRPLPTSVRVTERWPDGSIKWLLMDSVVPAAARNAAGLVLEYGSDVSSPPIPQVFSVSREVHGCRVAHGGIVVEIGMLGDALARVTSGDGETVCAVSGLRAVAADGRRWRWRGGGEHHVSIEEQTPFRCVIRIRGRLASDSATSPLRFDDRIHLFAGQREVLYEPGFFLSPDEPELPLSQISVAITGPWAGERTVFGGAAGEHVTVDGARARLLQTGTEAFGSGGRYPFVINGADAGTIAGGERAAGWVHIEGGPLVAMPHFWEQYPKALQSQPGQVTVDLWPGDSPTPFIAHAGAGKSHRVGISFGPGPDPARWAQPIVVAAAPEWYCASGAFGEMVPRREGRYEAYEDVVDRAFAAMLAERAGYGMENWGDVWQPGYVRGARTWSNQEWDLANSWLTVFVRAGNTDALDFAREAARHYADVDCIHDSGDPGLVGGAWMHAHTSLEGHQLEPPNFAHAGWIEGMLNIYRLTGDRRGLEASEALADWICRRAPLRERMPPRGPPYSLVIQRSAGWPLTTLCAAYQVFRKPEYLQTARRIADYARRCQDPRRGVWDAQVGHERPYRGGCVFAFTLLRGLRLLHDITGDEDIPRQITDAATWVFGEMWRPGHRYLYEQCPLHEPGTIVPFILGDMAGLATRLSRNPIYAAIASDELRTRLQEQGGESLVKTARRSQWANGILQQLPRLLYDWEQTGLASAACLKANPRRPLVDVPFAGETDVSILLTNAGDKDVEALTLRTLVRGDWKAQVTGVPSRLPPGRTTEVGIRCTAPVPTERYELQNDLAHLHVLAAGRCDGRDVAALSHVRLELADALALDLPPILGLRAGETRALQFGVRDHLDPSPEITVEARSDGSTFTVGPHALTAHADGAVTVSLPITTRADAGRTRTKLALTVRSGPRCSPADLQLECGALRVLLLESGADAERCPAFDAMLRYPGIVPELVTGPEVERLVPRDWRAIAERWDIIVLEGLRAGASAFSSQQLAAMADFVRHGGGLMVAGGRRSYGSGGYGATPLAGLLPVTFSGDDYAFGQSTPTVSLTEARLFEKYEAVFPALAAHHRCRPAKGARVLAVFDDGSPFMACASAGDGRVLCFTAPWHGEDGAAFRHWPRYGTLLGRCVRWLGKELPLLPDAGSTKQASD